MLWLIYMIIAVIVCLIVSITLIWGDISVARHAAKHPESMLGSYMPGALWLFGAAIAGALIGALWPIAITGICVNKYVQARADNAARLADQQDPCSERRKS